MTTADDFQAKTDATKAVDGDFSTAWTIDNYELPQSLTVDLGAVRNLEGVRVLWESAGVAHRYMIEASADASDWQTVIDARENEAAVSQPEDSFKARARYLRLTLTGYDDMGGQRERNMRPWPGVRELEVF